MVYCLSWLQCLWSDRPFKNDIPEKTTFDVLSLPDDITVDILSRLSIEDVVSCRDVCWRWRCLTSTPLFSELHSKRVGVSSVFILQYELDDQKSKQSDERPVLYVEDSDKILAEAKEFDTGDHMCNGSSPEFLASCNGFLLVKLRQTSTYVIHNPVDREGGLTLTWLPDLRVSIPGFFFDESTKEYALLFSKKDEGFQDTRYSLYYLKSRESKPLGNIRYSPDVSGRRPAVCFDGALFLMVEHQYRDGRSHPHCSKSILMIKLKKNNNDKDYLTLLPHPGNRCGFISSHEKHSNMRLSSDTNSQLLFSEMHIKAVHIWVLKDIMKWSWVKFTVVDFDRFEFRCLLCFGDSFMHDHEPRFLGIQNGELVLHWPNRGVYLYNMHLQSVRKIRGSRLPKESSAISVYALSYTKSLASRSDLGVPSTRYLTSYLR